MSEPQEKHQCGRLEELDFMYVKRHRLDGWILLYDDGFSNERKVLINVRPNCVFCGENFEKPVTEDAFKWGETGNDASAEDAIEKRYVNVFVINVFLIGIGMVIGMIIGVGL